jgi:hypothetical protein
VDEDDPRKRNRQTPTLCLDFGSLRKRITSTLASVVGVDLNVLEVLWVINHIQHESVADASEGDERQKSSVPYMIVNRNHWTKV